MTNKRTVAYNCISLDTCGSQPNLLLIWRGEESLRSLLTSQRILVIHGTHKDLPIPCSSWTRATLVQFWLRGTVSEVNSTKCGDENTLHGNLSISRVR